MDPTWLAIALFCSTQRGFASGYHPGSADSPAIKAAARFGFVGIDGVLKPELRPPLCVTPTVAAASSC